MPDVERPHVPDLTDEEEAKIQARIAADPDNPELSEDDFARMRPAAEVLPAELYAKLPRPRGRPKSETTKIPVKLRIDPDVLDAYKATGPGWQTRMNDALRKAAPKSKRDIKSA